MPTPISSIRNLGPAFERCCIRAGIASAEALRAAGPDAAYAKLLAAGNRPHFIAYYAMVMGLQGRPWNDCKGAEKEALRERFDKIKSQTIPDLSGIEAELNRIGVLPVQSKS